MYYDLLKIDKEMDMTKYSLKDLALYFEKFDGYICEIKTDNRILKFMFDINSLPHLIGLHHAFKGKKNRNEYKDLLGLKPGTLTHNVGDCHIYDRHVPLVKKLLEAKPVECKPKLVINNPTKDFYEFKVEDFEIEGYDYNKEMKLGKIPVAE